MALVVEFNYLKIHNKWKETILQTQHRAYDVLKG